MPRGETAGAGPGGGGHAVVVGGGLAGLAATRVLAAHFARVTLVERDRLPNGPDRRPGVPQAAHVHNLLARGRRALEGLFPGLDAELAGAGAPAVDWTADARWYYFGGWKPRFPSGIVSRTCTRPLLERAVRRRLLAAGGGRVTSAAGLEYQVFDGAPTDVVTHFRALAGAGIRYFIVAASTPERVRLLGERVLPALAQV